MLSIIFFISLIVNSFFVMLYVCVFVQLFPQIEEIMVQPLRDSRDHYEELKQIDDAMTEVDSPLLPPFIAISHPFGLNICTLCFMWLMVQY